MPSINTAGSDPADALLEEIRSTDVEPLWAKMTKLNPPEPQAKAVPHVWRYHAIRPYLLRAGELITEKQAERRVLMLINPNMSAPCTTDTLYAGLQLVMPGRLPPDSTDYRGNSGSSPSYCNSRTLHH
jgi:gentisate 1,2-dioxygenase